MIAQNKIADILKAAAIYDIVVTGILVIPPLVPLVFSVIRALDASLGFGTVFAEVDATTVFFVDLAAATVIVWAAIRIRQPNLDILWMDAIYRCVLVLCQVWAVAHGATPILLAISAILAIIAALEFATALKNSNIPIVEGSSLT